MHIALCSQVHLFLDPGVQLPQALRHPPPSEVIHHHFAVMEMKLYAEKVLFQDVVTKHARALSAMTMRNVYQCQNEVFVFVNQTIFVFELEVLKSMLPITAGLSRSSAIVTHQYWTNYQQITLSKSYYVQMIYNQFFL